MPSAYTDNLQLEQPAHGEQVGTWEQTLNANAELIDRVLAVFSEDAANHAALNFAYGPGRVWDGTTLTDIAADVVALADDAANYVEVDPTTGVVSANVAGWTAGSIPLWLVTAAAGAITVVVCKIPLLSAAGGGGGAGGGNGDVRGWVPGDLFVKTGANRVMVTQTGTITKVLLRIATGPTGSALICDLHLNGTSIWDANQANRVTIADGSTTGTATAFDTDAVTEGDELRLDVDQIGSTIGGAELVWGVLIAPA